jgi:hypothetical protein
MAKAKWYRWTFEDGTVSICKGYSKTELYWEVKRHGKLISKVLEF